ncbi:ubiquitin conjugation factor E4 [Saccharata proteae CBS 121410]|uniref:Ubiquitin conjugation factor E4 n=1 Tax=Saccharata proteae CBS 121410 TaxID=1314787 RepID=A0A9P4LTZ5_9PEZI|nr:ubiquitin conjugation factor E4 [Saccharata proteae CBS 121410]
MADAQSDADKIRNKRLAKLGGLPAPSTTPPATGESSASSSAPAPVASTPSKSENSSPRTDSPSVATPPPNNPFSQLGIKSGNESPASKITITNKSSVPQKRDSNHESRSQSRTRTPVQESTEAWEHRLLSTAFRVTLDEDNKQDLHGNKLSYVPGVKADLEEAESPLLLSTSTLDQAILEAASGRGKSFLEYLFGCWKRVVRLSRQSSSADKNDPTRAAVLREARRLCMSYIIFAVTMPEMFGMEPWAVNPLAQHLLVDPDDERGVCHDFLAEAVSRFEEDESIKEAFVGAIEQLSRDLAKKNMNDDFKAYVQAIRNVCQYPPMVAALSQSPSFLPENIEAPRIELDTLLGPFFRISPLQAEVSLTYFSGARTKDKGAISAAQNALRMTLQNHQDDLFDIANRFIRAKDSRSRMLDWFALTVNKNHKRRAMRTDVKQVSSDGFMTNVTVVLDRLCDPFVDSTFSKIDRIDIGYLRRNPRVDITEETKMNADQHESDAFYSQKLDGENNFISECFFLTVAAHHYGTEAANSKLSQLQKDVKWMEKELAKFEAERHKYAHNPAQLQMFENALKKYRDSVEKSHCQILATQGILLDETIQGRAMQFMRYVIVWLIRVAAPGLDYPKQQLSLPLPSEQPEEFKCLPEYFLEDIVDNFKFITRMIPQIVTSTQCSELIAICITFLRSSSYIRNPYLKSGLVSILYYGTLPYYGKSKGVLGDLLFADSFATKHLLHAVMQFYIECESTGAHTQFYDKFNIRYEIFQIIKCIWGNSVYRDNLRTEANVNLDFFVRFVNLLLNDVTYVLDESFTAFATIHDTTKSLRSDSTLDEASRKEKEEQLENAKQRAKSYMGLTNETVAMLKLFTDALSDSFTMPEIVQRLADMLDYNLDALVGPRQSQLKIENPQEYGWNAKAMLAEITDVYLNLRDKDSFWIAIARDGRSYKPSNFAKAAAILRKYALKSPEDIAAWEQLATHVAAAKEADEEEEADLGDIPDEFLDPLLSDIMKDPVILPKSRVVVDRSTIVSHLLSDMTDPFNRTPLKIEDVIPDTELKAKIAAFRAERKAVKAAERAHAVDQDGADAMDTST